MKTPPRLNKGLLDDVLTVVAVAHNHVGGAKQAPLITFDELSESVNVAVLSSQHQVPVFALGRSVRMRHMLGGRTGGLPCIAALFIGHDYQNRRFLMSVCQPQCGLHSGVWWLVLGAAVRRSDERAFPERN